MRWRRFFRRASRDTELAKDIESYLDAETEEQIARGVSIDVARERARRKFGNATLIREEVYRMNRPQFLEMSHYKFAFRTLARHRTAYLSVAAVLALGIGMSVAMFTLVDAVLLHPLPFPAQQSIEVIWKTDPTSGNYVEEMAYPELRDLQDNIQDFESVAVMPTSLYGYGKVLQVGTSDPVEIESAPVSHDFFRVLGVSPMIGRDFQSSDEGVGAAPVVIISNRVWREQLRGNPNIAGEMIRLNGVGHTVIGVMAEGVEFPRGAGLWVPLGIEERVIQRRGATFLQAIARLKPGRSRDSVFPQLNALLKRLASEYPEVYSKSQRPVITPLVEYWTGSARIHLWIMLGASVLLLLAAAISSGNLLLSHTLSRRTELATRLAFGATGGQIMKQLFAEGVIIAGIAAAAGLAISGLAIRTLVRWAPADIPRLPEAVLNFRGFCLAAATAALAAVACSIVPAWSTVRTNLERALREGGRSSVSRTGRRMRSGFVLVQAAVTVMLLVIAMLLVLSYRSMMSADIGFGNRDALSMNLPLRGPGVFSAQTFNPASRRAFYSDLLKRLRESTGVTSAAGVLLRPLEGTIGWDVTYQFEVDPNQNNALPKANYEVVTAGYFDTVGTSILEGRDFGDQDSATGERVTIVSRTLGDVIRKAGRDPLGTRVRLGLGGWARVIGVCADGRYRSVTQRGADIFVPATQAAAPTNYVVIRGTRPTAELAALVRDTLKKIDSNQAISGVATIGELIDSNAARHRFNMRLLLWFGICALMLSAAGVYGVIAESTAERQREIAIRNALGAQKPRLIREIIAGTLALVLVGEAVGVGCVLTLSRAVSEVLYAVSARDPVVLGCVGLFLLATSTIASFWPAWIAAGRDPRNALSE
jgi:putative ABC transport system permease protein